MLLFTTLVLVFGFLMIDTLRRTNMKWLILILLLALILVGGFAMIDAGHGDSNAIRDTVTCASAVQSSGGTVLDAVRACNPLTP